MVSWVLLPLFELEDNLFLPSGSQYANRDRFVHAGGPRHVHHDSWMGRKRDGSERTSDSRWKGSRYLQLCQCVLISSPPFSRSTPIKKMLIKDDCLQCPSPPKQDVSSFPTLDSTLVSLAALTFATEVPSGSSCRQTSASPHPPSPSRRASPPVFLSAACASSTRHRVRSASATASKPSSKTSPTSSDASSSLASRGRGVQW